MNNKLTEWQTWKVIGDAFATPRKERTEYQKDIMGAKRYNYGICDVIDELYIEDNITLGLRGLMISKIKEELGMEVFFCRCSPANDILRSQYCYSCMFEMMSLKELEKYND